MAGREEEWDLPEYNFLLAPFALPIQVLISDFDKRVLGSWINKAYGKFITKGNGLGLWSWAIILLGFFIDDFGTSYGFQATEWTDPTQQFRYEGNIHYSQYCETMAKRFGLTESTSIRLMFLYNMVLVFLADYFGLVGPYLRATFIGTTIYKAYAGYGWWSVEPNSFSFIDNLYKPGKPTPWRKSEALMLRKQQTHFGQQPTDIRRRLQSDNMTFLKTLRDIILPTSIVSKAARNKYY